MSTMSVVGLSDSITLDHSLYFHKSENLSSLFFMAEATNLGIAKLAFRAYAPRVAPYVFGGAVAAAGTVAYATYKASEYINSKPEISGFSGRLSQYYKEARMSGNKRLRTEIAAQLTPAKPAISTPAPVSISEDRKRKIPFAFRAGQWPSVPFIRVGSRRLRGRKLRKRSFRKGLRR